MPPSIPPAPVLGFSFTGQSTNNPTSQQPGVQLDAEFNRTNGAVAALIGAVSVSFNADGSLKSSAVQSAYAAAAPPPGGTNIADAPSAASAVLAQAWAEYLPDQLPAATLAGTGITGDHYSARYWANHADVQVSDTQNKINAFSALLTATSPTNGLPGVQQFIAGGTYAAQALVANGGVVYRAKATVNPGQFDATQWDQVTGTTPWVPPLPLAGGTLTGPLTLSGAPTLTLHATTKTYVDTADALALPKSGGTMTGSLTMLAPILLSADPVGPLQPATKQYADAADALALPKTGGTMTGALTLSGAPTVSLHPATKLYVDTADALALPKTGGTMTGALTLSGAPTVPLHPATKAYADGLVAGNVGRNKLLNPMFTVQQRGAGPWTASGYTADRWQLSTVGDTASVTLVALADADRTAIGDEAAETALQAVFTGAATAANYVQFVQNTENVRHLAGKTVTLSCWMKASAALNVGLRVSQLFGSGGSPSPGLNLAAVTQPITTSWARYTATFTVPVLTGKTLGTNNDHCFTVALGLSSGSTNSATLGVGVQSGTVQFWGMQLEVGNGATPLEKRPIQQELALCMRFYQTGQIYYGGYSVAGVVVAQTVLWGVQMRVTPTAAIATNSSGNAGTVTLGILPGGFYAQGTVAANGGFSVNVNFTMSAEL